MRRRWRVWAAGVLLVLPPAAAAIGGRTEAVGEGPRDSVRGDFDGDGFADLAIAAPSERPGGTVHVLYGSVRGLTARGSQVWSQDSPGVAGRAETGDGFGEALAVGDLNGDGRADLVVGVPGEGHTGSAVYGPGAVQVLYGSPRGLTAAGSRLWSQDTPGVPGHAEPGDAFGRALVVADLTGDRRPDLAVGVPGEDQGTGVVQVLAGSSRGVRATGGQWWSQDSPGVPGRARRDDRFGDVLAAGDLDGNSRPDLAVGVAGDDVGGRDGAGAVDVLYGAADGLTGRGSQRWSQDNPGVEGTAETGDGFGATVVIADFDGDRRDDLAVGVPAETLAQVAEAAGAVNVVYGAPSGLTAVGNQLWSQDTPGVAGTSQPRELFGDSLAAGDLDGDGMADLAIGVPSQSLGDPSAFVPEAGIVQVLPGSTAGLTATGSRLWSQDSPGVPGRAEESDRFGSSLAVADLDADRRADLAVGSPGDDVGGHFGAGVVHVLPGSPGGLTSAGSRQWSQATPGVAGAPERLAFFGWTVAAG